MARSPDPEWHAPLSGHDWVCEDSLRGARWLKSLVPREEMNSRLDQCRERYAHFVKTLGNEYSSDFTDVSDQAAWHVFQADTFASGRDYWIPDESARTVPYIRKIGKELTRIKAIPGAIDRAARMMTSDKAAPISGIYEILVAATYARHGWKTVEFVPEQPGVAKTADLHVSDGKKVIAVECKRMASTGGKYAAEEKIIANTLASAIHDISERRGVSLICDIEFTGEVKHVDQSAVESAVEAFCGRPSSPRHHSDDTARIVVRKPDWDLVRKVMRKDKIFVGSTRMMEVVSGKIRHDDDHSIRVKFSRTKSRPAYADQLIRVSLVNWNSTSQAAIHAKSRHFKSLLAKAERQLPADRDGIIHIGMEARGRVRDDDYRHRLNMLEAHRFSLTDSKLKWIYGNYFTHETTVLANESLAMNETMVPYRVGFHRTKEPAPYHMLVAEEDGDVDNLQWGFPS